MVGLMQIMIYLFCIYLVYKGIEIFQIAYTSRPENYQSRKFGVVIGILAVIASIVIGVGAVLMTEELVARIGSNMPNMR